MATATQDHQHTICTAARRGGAGCSKMFGARHCLVCAEPMPRPQRGIIARTMYDIGTIAADGANVAPYAP